MNSWHLQISNVQEFKIRGVHFDAAGSVMQEVGSRMRVTERDLYVYVLRPCIPLSLPPTRVTTPPPRTCLQNTFPPLRIWTLTLERTRVFAEQKWVYKYIIRFAGVCEWVSGHVLTTNTWRTDKVTFTFSSLAAMPVTSRSGIYRLAAWASTVVTV